MENNRLYPPEKNFSVTKEINEYILIMKLPNRNPVLLGQLTKEQPKV
jgi:hypothetical protein